MRDNTETPLTRTAESAELGPLTDRELLVLGAILQPQDLVERFVRGHRADISLIWVATTAQLLMIEQDLRTRDAFELPYSQVAGVELEAGPRGATIRVLARGRWHVLDGADHELGRAFAAHVFARCRGEDPWATGTETRGWQRGRDTSSGDRGMNSEASAA